MRLKDKVALITGAGMGQGRAACVLFAKEGAKIVGLDINKEALNGTIELVKKEGGEMIGVKSDVASEKDVENAVKEGVKAFGKLNILYNNAGVLWRDKDFEVTKTIEANWDRAMDINLKGPLWVTKHGIPELIKAGGGSIINIGSISALLGFKRAQDSYTSAKGALVSLTKSLAIRYAADKVRANIIHPGFINTPMQAEFSDEDKASCAAGIPVLRMGVPDDIAYLALYLASDESTFMTGSELIIDGGTMINGG
jgi:NAD(P)-dependent dehydrogenase (short-subunit alcohol dehydrogenase family)